MASSRFIRLPGTARKYLDTVTGREISRRQRDAIADEIQIRTKMEASRKAANKRALSEYRSLVDTRLRALQNEGKSVKLKDVMTDKTFKQEIKELKKANKKLKKLKSKGAADTDRDTVAAYREAQRLKRALLEKSGRREGIPSWVPPGWSDKYRAGVIQSPKDIPRNLRITGQF